MKSAYSVIACFNRTSPVRYVASGWRYSGSLNVYRLMSGSEALVIVDQDETPPGPAVYVVNALFDRRVLDQHGLEVVYHGRSTDIVVAAKPEFAQMWRSSACLVNPIQ